MNPEFKAGNNIAMKVPFHEYDATVRFYRDILGFEEVVPPTTDAFESVIFKFGDKHLWIDKISGISQAEIWLEIVTEDIESASKHFEKHGCTRRDEIEPLPNGFKGLWLTNPANIIHLIAEE